MKRRRLAWNSPPRVVASFVAAAALAAAALTAAGPAIATPVHVAGLHAISGATPFPNGCGVTGEQTRDSEGEPHVAVNPRDARNIIAVWQQDRFSIDGGALTNVVGVSKDGGATWKPVLVPGVSRCTGGKDERTSDPWVSFGPDGTAYLATLTFTEVPPFSTFELAGPTGQRVSTSHDGGLTWSAPATVIDQGTYDDREAITADPTKPGHAYLAWVKRYGSMGESGLEQFSRTVDGGRNWSPPAAIYVPPSGFFPDPTLLEVLPDGTLLNLFFLLNGSVQVAPSDALVVPWQVMAMRSTDGGSTWSAPVTVATSQPYPPTDPDSGRTVRAFPLISAGVGPDGTAYVAWNEKPGSGVFDDSQVLVSRSTDGGVTWSPANQVVHVRGQVFLPTLAVHADGTVGIAYDDTRNDRRGDNQFTTDVWFSHSHDRGVTWQETHVAGPFDLLTAPRTGSAGVAGIFIGDYQGMTALNDGFGAVLPLSRPSATIGPSDVFFAHLALRGHGSVTGSGTRARLRLSVSPRRVRAGTSRRFSFRVVTGSGRSTAPVPGATVSFASQLVKTNTRGRARIRARFTRRGLRKARARKSGFVTGLARVRVLAGRRSGR